MRFGILGPLEVSGEESGEEAGGKGGRLAIGGPRQRALLAMLLLEANRVVSADRLIAGLWGDEPGETARGRLQGCVRELRKSLGGREKPVITCAPGYLIEIGSGELDLDRFEHLSRVGRELAEGGDLPAAAAALREALGLWRGPALDDVPLDACRHEIDRLAERRLAVLIERIDIDLRLGRAAELVGELRVAVAENPLRERLWGQLMRALADTDRQAEALAAYRELRDTLAEQLGLAPSAPLRRLEHAILTGVEIQDHDQPGTGSARANLTPAQLPAVTAAFTGRARELKQLDSLLSTVDNSSTGEVPIGLITGTAGVGKTALAVYWAHQVRARFTDGQLYVDLRGYAATAPVSPLDALAGLLPALGVPADQVPLEADRAAALYRSLLSDRRMLVVLDNARNAAQVRPLLPGSHGCLVLVTSRDRLGGLIARDGAHRHRLDLLDPADASTLLARVLGAERVAAEPEPTGALARACGYLPLALRIAAANLADRPGRTIAALATELSTSDALTRLAIDGDEHSAVRSAFDLSYAALTPAAQRMFRLLALIPGPDIAVPAVAALTELPVESAAQLLDRLTDAHLVEQPVPGRYALHDLLGRYAAERAEDGGDDRASASHRLLTWYLRTADAAARALHPAMLRLPVPDQSLEPAPAAALEWLEAERQVLIAATDRAAREGPRSMAWRLADTLRGYFWQQAPSVDWLQTVHAGLAAAQADGDLRAQAAMTLSIADAHNRGNDLASARRHYRKAAELARRTSWPEGRSAALGNLGHACWQAGDLRGAVARYTEALAIDRETGWQGGQVVKLSNLALVYFELGRLADAEDHHTQALALDRELGAKGGEALDLGGLGEVRLAHGDHERAEELFTAGLALSREVGDRMGEAELLRGLAEVHRDTGRLTSALDLARAAVDAARESTYRRVEANTLNVLATVQDRLGHPKAAIAGHQTALDTARAATAPYPAVGALIGLATAYDHLGRRPEAIECATEARALARSMSFTLLAASAHSLLAALSSPVA